MSDADDASTDIESKVKAFAKDINAETAKLLKGVKNRAKKQKTVVFSMARSKVSKSRTPKEQAKLLTEGSTQVCWSAHMADKARHVTMKVDGKLSWDAKEALGDKFDAFRKAWGRIMKKHDLKNAAGRDGWPGWDQFHLELDNAKIKRTDSRAAACVEEYVRLTRKENKPKNAKFEKKYKNMVEKAEKRLKMPQKAKEKTTGKAKAAP